ncbi:hypothetical protein NFJ02_18g29980 [Pycnococcus provasolii]
MSLCSLASHFQVHAAKGTNEDGGATLSYQAAALSFVYLWAALSLLAIPLILAMSAAAFRFYYWRPTTLAPLWSRHRHHHVFSNPSPFAVLADDYLDQCVRAAPMLVLPAHQHTLHYTRA